MAASGRVLVLSAAIGEGHDLPARWLAAGLAEEDPAIDVEIADGLAAMGRLSERVVLGGSSFESVWGNRGFDLHLVTHPESIAEVRAVAGTSTDVVAVRGLNDPAFLVERSRADARRALDLPPEGPVVVVSGGGWGVGDLSGAIDTVLAVDG